MVTSEAETVETWICAECAERRGFALNGRGGEVRPRLGCCDCGACRLCRPLSRYRVRATTVTAGATATERLIIPAEATAPAVDGTPGALDGPRDTVELTVVRRQDGRKCWRVSLTVPGTEPGTRRILTLGGRPAEWRCRTEAEADRAYLRFMGRLMASPQFGGIVGSSHDDVTITGEMLGGTDGEIL